MNFFFVWVHLPENKEFDAGFIHSYLFSPIQLVHPIMGYAIRIQRQPPSPGSQRACTQTTNRKLNLSFYVSTRLFCRAKFAPVLVCHQREIGFVCLSQSASSNIPSGSRKSKARQHAVVICNIEPCKSVLIFSVSISTYT